MKKHYLLVSDFDQTLSFNDSGLVLSEMLGISGFQERVHGLSRMNLVQSGAELTYLLRHDPDFRGVRKTDLIEVGKRIRLKRNISLLAELLSGGIDGFRFDFFVVSAAPWDVVHSALEESFQQITSSELISRSKGRMRRSVRSSRFMPVMERSLQ